MICPRCNTMNPPGTSFCQECGVPLPTVDGMAPGMPGLNQVLPPGFGQPPAPISTYPGSPPLGSPPLGSPPPSAPFPSYGLAAQPYSPDGSPSFASPPSLPFYTSAPAQRGLAVYSPITLAPVPATFPPRSALDRVLGADAPITAQPVTRFQATLERSVSVGVARSKWAMAIAGTTLATVLALALTWGLQVALATGLRNAASAATAAANLPPAARSLAAPVARAFTPSLLTLLMFELGTPYTAHYVWTSGGYRYVADATVRLPITALLLIPAIALILGGYIAGAGDYQRRPGYSIARGALIGPFFAAVVGVVALLGTTTYHLAVKDVDASLALSPSLGLACAFALLWGVVFGAFGGWLQLSGLGVLSAALPTLQLAGQRSLGAARLMGAVAGAAVALACGILIFLVLALAGVGFAVTSAASTVTAPAGLGSAATTAYLPAAIPLAAALAIVFAPPAAIWAFALASGGALGATAAPPFSLLPPHLPPSAQALYAVMAVPAISYLAGGRVAARVARAARVDSAFAAGACIAVPVGVLLAAAAYLASGSVAIRATAQAPLQVAVGPVVLTTALAGVVAAAIIGGIGGASAVAMPWLGELPGVLMLPLFPVSVVLYPLFDVLTGVRPSMRRSAARKWTYDGVLAAIVLGCLAVVLERTAVDDLRTMSYWTVASLHAWAALALIAVPLVFFVGAAVSAFSAPAQTVPSFLLATGAGGYAAPGGLGAAAHWPVVVQPASVPLAGYPGVASPAFIPSAPSNPYGGLAAPSVPLEAVGPPTLASSPYIMSPSQPFAPPAAEAPIFPLAADQQTPESPPGTPVDLPGGAPS